MARQRGLIATLSTLILGTYGRNEVKWDVRHVAEARWNREDLPIGSTLPVVSIHTYTKISPLKLLRSITNAHPQIEDPSCLSFILLKPTAGYHQALTILSFRLPLFCFLSRFLCRIISTCEVGGGRGTFGTGCSTGVSGTYSLEESNGDLAGGGAGTNGPSLVTRINSDSGTTICLSVSKNRFLMSRGRGLDMILESASVSLESRLVDLV